MARNSESLDEDVMFDEEAPGATPDLGTLVDPTPGADDEADAVALEDREDDPAGVDNAPQDLGEVQPAEEAAMHLVDDADGSAES